MPRTDAATGDILEIVSFSCSRRRLLSFPPEWLTGSYWRVPWRLRQAEVGEASYIVSLCLGGTEANGFETVAAQEKYTIARFARPGRFVLNLSKVLSGVARDRLLTGYLIFPKAGHRGSDSGKC